MRHDRWTLPALALPFLLVLGCGAPASAQGRGPGGTPCGMPFDTGCLPGYHCVHAPVDAEGHTHHDAVSCVEDGTPAEAHLQWELPAVAGAALAIGGALVFVRNRRLKGRA